MDQVPPRKVPESKGKRDFREWHFLKQNAGRANVRILDSSYRVAQAERYLLRGLRNVLPLEVLMALDYPEGVAKRLVAANVTKDFLAQCPAVSCLLVVASRVWITRIGCNGGGSMTEVEAAAARPEKSKSKHSPTLLLYFLDSQPALIPLYSHLALNTARSPQSKCCFNDGI
jgi:hypothetical protein